MSTPVPCAAWADYADLPIPVQELHSEADWCAYLTLATDILWSATQRRWRTPQTETVALRAAPPRAGEPGWPYERSWGRCGCYLGVDTNFLPIWSANPWTIAGFRRHFEPAAVRLPRSDVTSVTEVLLDGAPFTGWALDGSWLARTDGLTWPVCGDRTSVTYTFGRPPPDGGRVACITLAAELGRAASPNPDQACQLPKRIQSVTRQALSFAALDDFKMLDGGLTGLFSVDAWLRSVNPKARTQEARCWSPDLPIASRR